MYGLMQTINAQ